MYFFDKNIKITTLLNQAKQKEPAESSWRYFDYKNKMYRNPWRHCILPSYCAQQDIQGNQSSGKMRLGEFSLNIARLAYISTSELS